MIATSTPEASGPSPSPGPRSSNQPDRRAASAKPVAPGHVVEVVDRARAEVGDERRGAALQLELLVGVPGVHGLRLLCFLDPRRGPGAQLSFTTLPVAFSGSSSTISTAARHLVVGHLRRGTTR